MCRYILLTYMLIWNYRISFISSHPWIKSIREWLSWRQLTPPSNSSHMVMQSHSLLATRTTWMTQITSLASLCSRTVLHCVYVAFVAYKDVSHVHFNDTCATGAHARLGWKVRWTRPRFVPAGKYCLKLIVPMEVMKEIQNSVYCKTAKRCLLPYNNRALPTRRCYILTLVSKWVLEQNFFQICGNVREEIGDRS